MEETTNRKEATMRIIKKTEDGRYALIKDHHFNGTSVPLGIYQSDGTEKGQSLSNGWYLVQDDALDLCGDFEYHVENLREEMRYLIADAQAEFGYEV